MLRYGPRASRGPAESKPRGIAAGRLENHDQHDSDLVLNCQGDRRLYPRVLPGTGDCAGTLSSAARKRARREHEMKTLLLLRHAKSSWKKPVPDHQRPLNKRGKRAAVLVGEEIRQRGLLPDLVLCSTAKRARKTAKRALEAARYQGEVHELDQLYRGGLEGYFNALVEVPDFFDRVMLIGHNPDLEDLLVQLTGQWERLPTAALARVDLEIESWSELSVDSGRLTLLLRPRELEE